MTNTQGQRVHISRERECVNEPPQWCRCRQHPSPFVVRTVPTYRPRTCRLQVRVASDYAHALADLHNDLPRQSNFADAPHVLCGHTRDRVVVTQDLGVVFSSLEGM